MTDLNQALIRLHGAVAAAGPFNSATGSPTPGQGRVRVEQALARFNKACRGREAGRKEMPSTIFGDVSVADFARFQELHVRHHLPQLAESDA
ncbi:MAG TPA: hypothetical protein VLB12_06785 [Gemmatimonadales bacterium]|nr:hypothetical protein [Gemmatimonadales bacterium]